VQAKMAAMAMIRRLCAGLLVSLMAAVSQPAFAAAPAGAIIETLKEGCLAATVKAINLEIGRHQRWLEFRREQGDQQGAAAMEAALAQLKADLDKYVNMDANDYALPAPVEKTVWVGEPLRDDAVLSIEGMTMSGPWYHAAGIMGGDYGKLKPGARYKVTFYEVYPRSYWHMKSAYIFIATAEPMEAPQEGSLPGETGWRCANSSLSDSALLTKERAYLDEKDGIKFYGLFMSGDKQDLVVRLELGPYARKRLQAEWPPGSETLAVKAAVCRAKVSQDNGFKGFKVVEQVWLDDSNHIIGCAGDDTNLDAWPAAQLRSRCERFLNDWFSFSAGKAAPPQEE